LAEHGLYWLIVTLLLVEFDFILAEYDFHWQNMIYSGLFHSYWQNMQPIKSVLLFCSALPIQYTPFASRNYTPPQLSVLFVTVQTNAVVVTIRISLLPI